ncbi:bifunctional folylpolyglutamate synthase/dihydrofolate synthase [Candidatus Woesearchaeota archaeon]|nr:bifunctional folylpolyglutamate synthase/dihydrofolate synthase [Candidatus Woesearchaeota archaeon]
MNYKQAIGYIYSLKGSEHKGGFNLSLKNIRILLKKLNNPEKQLKVIHVAGTNGKGSVCAMLSSVLREAGYKTGTYTSPHLKDFRERFLINNQKITEDDLIKHFMKVKPHITSQTFFEVITAMAFLYFKEKKIDYLACEVGMGGRLDATNVARPIVSVITNISLEHQEYLGETVEKIAFEKAGIIKNKIPVVTGAKGAALDVIRKAAEEKNAELYTNGKPIRIPLRLNGRFQLENASIAMQTVKVLNDHYSMKIYENAARKGLLKTACPGRLEFISKGILVDCAHNLEAIRTLKKELIKIKKSYKRLHLIIGVLKDKDYRNMLDEIMPSADRVILVKPPIPRALEPKVMGEYLNKGLGRDYIIIENPKKALVYAKRTAEKDELILITGSIYVVGEVI